MKNRTNIMADCLARIADLSKCGTTISNLSGTVKTGMTIMRRLVKNSKPEDLVDENILNYIQDYASLHRLYSTEAFVSKGIEMTTTMSAVSSIAKQVTSVLSKKSQEVVASNKVALNIQNRLRKQLATMSVENFGDYDDTIANIITFDDFMKIIDDAGKYRRSVVKIIRNALVSGKLYRPAGFRKELDGIAVVEATKEAAGWNSKTYYKALEALKSELKHGFESTVHLAGDIKIEGKTLQSTLSNMRTKNAVLDRISDYNRDHTVAMYMLVNMLGTISL